MWLWCGIVLPSWQDFCTKVQEDLHDGVCPHKAALHLCTMTALLYVIWCVMHHGTQNATVVSSERSPQSSSNLMGTAMIVHSCLKSVSIQVMQASVQRTFVYFM